MFQIHTQISLASWVSWVFLEAKISHATSGEGKLTNQPFTNQPILKEAKERKLEGLVQRQSEVAPFLYIFLPGSVKNGSVYLQYSNYSSYLSHIPTFFHWTMIMGGKVT